MKSIVSGIMVLALTSCSSWAGSSLDEFVVIDSYDRDTPLNIQKKLDDLKKPESKPQSNHDELAIVSSKPFDSQVVHRGTEQNLLDSDRNDVDDHQVVVVAADLHGFERDWIDLRRELGRNRTKLWMGLGLIGAMYLYIYNYSATNELYQITTF